MIKRVSGVALLLLLLAGCASQQDFDSLSWEVNTLSSRLEKSNETFSRNKRLLDQCLKQQATLQARYAELQTEFMSLKGSIDEVSVLGAGVDDKRLDAMERRIDDFQLQLDDFASSTAVLYKDGLDAYKKAKYEEAIGVFDAYLEGKPDDSLVDNAHFWTGESLYQMGRYEDAVLSYDRVVKKFPGSEKVPDAMLKQGMSFLRLGDKQTGRLIMGRLVKEYGKSDAASRARDLLGGK
ncbi:MAG: tol-pal system protein YbgF [Thermodesulfobacteriota bacterium]|nr:tol-pal system protein YbgF [Thermodesulfobacteriota bacterium]